MFVFDMSKEFTINHAIYKTKGGNDECLTLRDIVERIVEYIPKEWVVWCPFDKRDSSFVRVLEVRDKKGKTTKIEVRIVKD